MASDSAECLPEQGLSVYFIQRMAKLRTAEVLIKPTFKQSKWVADRSNLTMSYYLF